jgi:sialic acid synthase SpsE
VNQVSQRDRDIFENLFVLEAANNHWGNVARGKQIVKEFGAIVRYNDIKAAIKFQFRDVDNFIHRDFKGNTSIRYISKTEATKMTREAFSELARAVVKVGCIPMATPFDETSVDMCVELDFPIIKVASSDVNDWPLLEKIASTRRPVIASSGGASEKSLDDLVTFFEHRSIPLAINHCVSLYPSEDDQLQLNQIDYLKARYPEHVIGFSTHEYRDWTASMYISYAKGARSWERHVDIDRDGVAVSPYCSLPQQIDEWFKAFHKAREMSGGDGLTRRVIPIEETRYLDALVRGVYARRDLPEGYVIDNSTFNQDFYLAIPLQKGQLSCREVFNGETLMKPVSADAPLTVNDVDGPYSEVPKLRESLMDRGLQIDV